MGPSWREYFLQQFRQARTGHHELPALQLLAPGHRFAL